MKSLLLALLLSSTFAAAGEITIVWTHAKNSDTVGYFSSQDSSLAFPLG